MVGCCWLAYELAGGYVLGFLTQIIDGVKKMTLIEGIPAEFETGIVIVSLLISLVTTYLVAVTRKGDYDKKNNKVSEWSKRWIIAAFSSVALGVCFSLIFTPWGVDVANGGESFGQFAIITAILSGLISWLGYIVMAEGFVEAFKDFQNKVNLGKEMAPEVKDTIGDAKDVIDSVTGNFKQ